VNARTASLVVSVDALSPLSAPKLRGAQASDRMPYYAELLRRLTEVPGVRSASLSHKAPISNEQGSTWDTFAVDGGVPPPPSPAVRNYLNAISPGYFATIGMPIVAGRDFTPADRDGTPRVVIVNQSLAREYFGNDSPIGQHLVMGRERTRLEVVGLVRDATYQNLHEDRRRIAYLLHPGARMAARFRAALRIATLASPAPGLTLELRPTHRH